jgi:hypothetical protein
MRCRAAAVAIASSLQPYGLQLFCSPFLFWISEVDHEASLVQETGDGQKYTFLAFFHQIWDSAVNFAELSAMTGKSH